MVVSFVAGRLDDDAARFRAALGETLKTGLEHGLAVVRSGVHA